MFLDNPTISNIVCELKSQSISNTSQFLLLIGEKCDLDLNKLVNALNQESLLFIGGIFPKVIYKNTTSDRGIVIKKVDLDLIPIYFNSESEFINQFSAFQELEFTTAFTLIDGASETASDHLMTLFTYLGNNVRFFGGGVGRLKTKGGILITNNGVFNTGTIVVFISSKTELDAQHGWTKSIGPFIVTKSEKNQIKEINWENAFEFYQKCLNTNQNINLTKQNFSDQSIHFPFGIYKDERDYIVRDPFEVNEKGWIKCIGNIPENSLIDILAIEHQQLGEIPNRMISNYLDNNKTPSVAIIFSCISRVDHLKSRFNQELDDFNIELHKHLPECDLEGALSIGEIYSSGTGYLELLNKSIVLGLAY